MAPFSEVNKTLLDIIRERYPNGLTTSTAPPLSTPIPLSDDEMEVVFATLKNPSDPSKGWKVLAFDKDDEKDTAVRLGLYDGSIVAFTFRPIDSDDDDDVEFLVEWPKLDYDEDLDEDGMET
jgi:hypothetical protein